MNKPLTCLRSTLLLLLALGSTAGCDATCNSGYTLSYVEYTWRVAAEDFGGNARPHGWAKTYWPP